MMGEEKVAPANINIGILGHVDSGKTSLARALSLTASTAAFDKSPESQRRGITLDLGFSACSISTAEVAPLLHASEIESIQFTFVDCPGHASLIRTILGGAQIIDIMVLVIDACKGIQTQTAECIVIGEVLCKPLVVVINKIDAVQGSTPAEKRATLDKMRKRLQKTFERTRWPYVQMVEVAAAPRRDDTTSEEVSPQPINVQEVISAILNLVDVKRFKDQLELPLRSEDFVMMFDHCFALKGQGTVFTGTVLRGQVNVGDSILVPESHVVKKVKGLQVFRKSVQQARQGDRVGLCVAQFDAEGVERGLLCSAKQQEMNGNENKSLMFQSTTVMIAEVNRIRFYQLACDTHTKFHITIGHSTVMGTMKFFSRPTVAAASAANPLKWGTDTTFDLLQESLYVEELTEDTILTFDSTELSTPLGHPVAVKCSALTYYAIILLEQPIMAAVGTPLIATRLDMNRENVCRIAIAGSVCALLNSGASGDASNIYWRDLPIVRFKSRELVVERVVNEKTCIASGVVGFEFPDVNNGGSNEDKKKLRGKDALHAEVQKFIGMRVYFHPTEGEENDLPKDRVCKEGIIDSAFGKTGKVKLVFKEPVFSMETEPLAATGDRAKRGGMRFLTDGVVKLTLKKYPLALHSHLQQ